MKFPNRLVLVTSLILLLFQQQGISAAEDTGKKWTNRLLPLPHEIHIAGSVRLTRDQMILSLPSSGHPLIHTAEEILRPLACGQGFEIRLALTSGDCPAEVKDTLAKVPNNAQAYAIQPILMKGRFHGLLLVANTPLGLLYAARTFNQLVSNKVRPDRALEIPQVTILDWPDLAERGQWGGDASQDLAWMAERKFNVVEVHSRLGFEEGGAPRASLDPKLLSDGKRWGIKVVPIILHLEQLAVTGLFRFHPEVAAVSEPGKPLPTDYTPPVCFSQPKTAELLSGWMDKLLGIAEVDEVDVWLSELENRCYCPRCAGKEPFVLETQGIIAAFEKTKPSHPGATLRLLLTQASYNSNEKVLAAVRPETRVIYYDGGRTYDSSHRPMIYPLLQDYARSGRWLGVYPQLTNSWRTVFPFTGPQFIQTRMQEFADKGLQSFIGYATPSNRYYEFNISAAAEWSWNSRGRSPREFAEAYANIKGFRLPEKFAQWAETIGTVGWNLAGSRSVQRLIFEASGLVFVDGRIVENNSSAGFRPLTFGQGILAEFENSADFEANRARAKKALSLAEKLKIPSAREESRCVVAALDLLASLKGFGDAISLTDERGKKREARQSLAGVDAAARLLTPALYRWGMTVNPMPRNQLASRFRDSVDFAAGTAGALWAIGAMMGIPDPDLGYRRQTVAAWSEKDFQRSPDLTSWADVTGLLRSAGEYDVTFQFREGASGVTTRSAALLCGKDPESARLISEDRWDFHIGSNDRYADYWLTVPRNPALRRKDEHLFLRMEIKGPGSDTPPDRRTSRGSITLRKSWRPEE